MALKSRARGRSLLGRAPVEQRAVPSAQLRANGIGAVEEFENGGARVLRVPDGGVIEQEFVQGLVPRGRTGPDGGRLNPCRFGVGEGIEGRTRVFFASG